MEQSVYFHRFYTQFLSVLMQKLVDQPIIKTDAILLILDILSACLTNHSSSMHAILLDGMLIAGLVDLFKAQSTLVRCGRSVAPR